MRLGAVLDKCQTITLADVSYLAGVGGMTIEMHYHDGASALGDGLFYLLIVYLKCVDARFHEYRAQTVFCYREDGSDVRVCRDNHFVALVHHSHLDVGTQYQGQRVQSVSHADAVAASHILREVVLKLPYALAFQIPSALNNMSHSLLYLVLVHRGDALQ